MFHNFAPTNFIDFSPTFFLHRVTTKSKRLIFTSHTNTFVGSNEEQLDEAERCIEQIIFNYIYKYAMFPNADADVLRDQ